MSRVWEIRDILRGSSRSEVGKVVEPVRQALKSIKLKWPRLWGLSSRIYTAFLLTAVIPTSIAGVVGIFYSLDALKRETLTHLEQEVVGRTDGLARFFDQLASELRYLASSTTLGELAVAGTDQPAARRLRLRLKQDFTAFAKAYPHIYQIRYLDAEGREVIRVDRRDGATYVVPDNELQDKSDRYYVHETLMLGPGEIYISPLDLNIESGKPEYPEKPVVRLGTPIADSAGTTRGLLIINLHAELLLDQIQQIAEMRGGRAYLVNASGFYLSRSADPESSRAFEMRSLEDLAQSYPRPLLAKILAGGRGADVLRDWIVAYAPVRLQGGIGAASGRPMEWAIILAFPEDRLFEAIFNLYLLYAILVISLAVTAVAGFLLSRRLLRPLTLLSTETEAIADGDFASRVEIKGHDEIADLGQRFNDMAARLERSYASLERQKQNLETEVLARTAALERERRNLATIIQNTGDGILSLSAEGIIELTNVAADRLLLGGGEGSVGRSIAALLPDWPSYLAVFANGDGLARRFDATVGGLTLSLNMAPIVRDGAAQGYILVVRDVSDERRLQEERRELDRQIFQTEKMATMGELAMGVAHEIGNPLAGIKTVVQALLGEERDISLARTYLERIEGEIDRLAAFLKTFHGFAAPQETHPVPCRLEDVLDDVFLWTRKEAKEHGIAIDGKHCSESVPALLADPNQLKQLMLNLVINAIHAMKHGGRLTVGMCGGGPPSPDGLPTMRFCVEDTGSGIPADVLPRIFDPFFTTRADGSGLGLAVVKKIAVQHGATIRVESTPGRGSRFELSWPIAGADASDGREWSERTT